MDVRITGSITKKIVNMDNVCIPLVVEGEDMVEHTKRSDGSMTFPTIKDL